MTTKKSPGIYVHPLPTFGYKSLLVLIESLKNYEEDLHACIFECTQRETGGQSCYYFTRTGQKKIVEMRFFKKLRGGEKLSVYIFNTLSFYSKAC